MVPFFLFIRGLVAEISNNLTKQSRLFPFISGLLAEISNNLTKHGIFSFWRQLENFELQESKSEK
jgi:hypothetical protein